MFEFPQEASFDRTTESALMAKAANVAASVSLYFNLIAEKFDCLPYAYEDLYNA